MGYVAIAFSFVAAWFIMFKQNSVFIFTSW